MGQGCPGMAFSPRLAGVGILPNTIRNQFCSPAVISAGPGRERLPCRGLVSPVTLKNPQKKYPAAVGIEIFRVAWLIFIQLWLTFDVVGVLILLTL